MIKSCRNHRNKTRNFYQATKRKRRKGDPKFFFSIALLFIARHKPATNSNSRNDSFEFFYSKEEKKGGESGEYWPFLWLHWPASPRASFENLAPPISCPPSPSFPVRWLRLPQVRNSLFRRGKYLIPQPRGKTGYCQWLPASDTIPPAPSSLIRQSLRPGEGEGGSVNPQGHLDTRAPGKSYFDQEEANLMYFIDFTPLRAS